MRYPTVLVNGIAVRVDEGGRYSLNDLHAAAVVNARQLSSKGQVSFYVVRRSSALSKRLKPECKKALWNKINQLE